MELTEYLDQLLEELHQLGVSNAYQIVSTTEEEIKKRLSSQSLNSILDGLGSPQAYAKQFKEQPNQSKQATNFKEPEFRSSNTRNILIGVLLFYVFIRFSWFIVRFVFGLLGFATWGIFGILGNIIRFGGDFFILGVIVVCIIYLTKNKNAS